VKRRDVLHLNGRGVAGAFTGPAKDGRGSMAIPATAAELVAWVAVERVELVNLR
jgi:hypothetical protein